MAANKYISLLSSGAQQEVQAKDTSAGAGDAGKIPALNSAGVLDITLFPAGIGQASQTFTASEALSAGAIVNIFTSGARNANATDGSKPGIGFVNASVASAATATVYFPGSIVTGLTGLTIGAPVYLGTTSGQATGTAPTGSGNLVQHLGYALTATSFIFSPTPGVLRA